MNLRRRSGADGGPDDDSRLLDVLIRGGLILALAVLCYQVVSPFLTLLIWALILAVTLYPLQQALANWMGGPGRALQRRCWCCSASC